MRKIWRETFKNYLFISFSSPWLLALIPTIIIVLLLPELFHKYNFTLEQKEDRAKTKMLTFFNDINGDGVKDKIDVLNYRNISACCNFQENNSLLKKQFNFYGNLLNQENLNIPIFNDVTYDGIKELFVFTQKADSLFLNAVDFKESKVILYGRFITKIGDASTTARDFVLRPIINHDYNNDGINEMYFLINGGFSLVPRKIMAYDFKNDTLISSINTGSQHFVTPIKTEDNKLYLISTTKATDNCPQDFSYPYKDNNSWIFGFNDKLEFTFKPICFKGTSTRVNGPVVFNNEYHFYVLNGQENNNYAFAINQKGDVLKKTKKKALILKDKVIPVKNKDKKSVILEGEYNNNIKHFEYQPETMTVLQSHFTNNLPNSSLVPLKIDSNKQGFIGVNNKTNLAYLYLNNFNEELEFNGNLYLKSWNFYTQTKNIKEGCLVKVTDKYFLYTFLLTKATYYPYRFLLFISIYLLSAGFVYLPQKLRRHIVLKREKLQKEITALQLQLVNSKLDPHFTFNALNTVSAKVLKGDRFEAYDLMTSFSSLMRSALFFSDKDSWSLAEELNFTKSYLTLMKGRFKNRFSYAIVVGEVVNKKKITIPRLLVQNFVENAVKHAFNGIDYEGLINIRVKNLDEAVNISIIDNGIGRKKAQLKNNNNPNKSGKGIGLNKKQIEIYNKLYKTNITIEIIDLFNTNISTGTEIKIVIPNL
ncbi:histidine kinase [Lutibacter sp. TH_r2]|uniref:sensor histidine kinase n=1 Tax=Lutibacter sp. TH_r2 TaxID=3082083 RepID=UPI00295344FA|nr:histidine kinase [Lutibacter sp. TH_r2]MDV7186088.1 histidine kinase [Lutibacter sp. TH_r2]